MAITVGTGNSIGSQVPASSATVSVTAPAGLDRLVIVAVAEYGAAPTGVTYGGDAMTQIGAEFNYFDLYRMTLWQKVGGQTGANNVVATFSGSTDQMWIGGVGMTGVDNVTPTSNRTTASGTATPATQGVTSAAGNVVIDFVDLSHSGGGGTLTVDASQTQICKDQAWGNSLPSDGMSYEAGAASVTMSWALGTVAHWGSMAVNINAAAASATNWGRMLGGELNRLVMRRV